VTTQNQAPVPADYPDSRLVDCSPDRFGVGSAKALSYVHECQSARTAVADSSAAWPVGIREQETIDRPGVDADRRAASRERSEATVGSACNTSPEDLLSNVVPYERGNSRNWCEILKQVADRFVYGCRPWGTVVWSLISSDICRHGKHMSVGLSEREAKFFLDREKQSSYHSRKFSGAFPARVKFLLHGIGKVVNCCSHFWGGAIEPLARYEGTRFRKAETDRPNQANERIPRLRSLREDRPVGVTSIPSAHGRKRYWTYMTAIGKHSESGAGTPTYVEVTNKRIRITKSVTKGVIMEDLNLCGRDWKGGY